MIEVLHDGETWRTTFDECIGQPPVPVPDKYRAVTSERRWVRIEGLVTRGHGIASGANPHSPYPTGSLEAQLPHYRERGLDLTQFHRGTLNVSIAPFRFSVARPSYRFAHIDWSTAHPPETFSFSPCRVIFRGTSHEAWLYYPHPETKERHFQSGSTMEVITHWIEGIKPGTRLEIDVDAEDAS